MRVRARRPALLALVAGITAALVLAAVSWTSPTVADSVSSTARAPESPAAAPATAPTAERAPAWRRHVLTEGPERIVMRSPHARALTFRGTNPTGTAVTHWNRRHVYTRAAARPRKNQTACATWRWQTTDRLQQGLAVRVRDQGGRLRAVTLTKNTFAKTTWFFNILTWDTARTGEPYRAVGQYDMGAVLGPEGRLLPLPWRACLRVQGRSVSFQVWVPRHEGRPSWQDPDHTRHARLPARFVLRGTPGWYVGHVPAGERATYTQLSP